MDDSPSSSKSAKKRKMMTKVQTTPINLELKFEDLGGLEEQIQTIQDEVIYCHKNSHALKKSGLQHHVGGVLLEGPPGTGKTICAHTIAAELCRQTNRNYSFYTHNAADCLSKWIGESEKTIRDLFEAAALNKPSIIFFDEFDAICPRRDHEKSSQEHRTLVATILSEFNKIQQNEILIIATTNLVTNIDPAMIRDGRFDFTINFPLPNEQQRRNIIEIKMKNFTVSQDILDFVSKQTSGYSGSALTLACTRAQRNAFKRQKSKLKNEALKYIDKIDFIQVLNTQKKTSNLETSNLPFGGENIFHFICQKLTEKIEPFTQFDEDWRDDKISKIFTPCFLIWSKDSNLILNKKIIPHVIHNLNLPVFLVSQDILESTVGVQENYESYTKIFKSIINKAVSNGKPCILFIENIDLIELPQEFLINCLKFNGQHSIFILATASQDFSKLSWGMQKLFKPWGLEKSFKLPPPSLQEVQDIFQEVVVSTIQKKLRKKLSHKNLINLVNRFMEATMKHKNYESLSDAISEIRLQCQISNGENLINDIYNLFP